MDLFTPLSLSEKLTPQHMFVKNILKNKLEVVGGS
jgi:hypothetical protein